MVDESPYTPTAISARKPVILVGCSTEALVVAAAVTNNLAADHSVQPWTLTDRVGLTGTVLERLIAGLAESEYAAFILQSDDTLTTRGATVATTRTNVIFEIGLAIGRLGRARTFMMYDRSSKPGIIDDLEGLICAEYDSTDKSEQLDAAIVSACEAIRKTIAARESREVWYTKWLLGGDWYVEHLHLTREPETRLGALPVSRVTGRREFQKIGGDKQTFRVSGIHSRDYYWLQYHRTDGQGGGTLILEFCGGKLHGVVGAGDCHAVKMRAYSQGWVPIGDEAEYNPKWQIKHANFFPDLSGDSRAGTIL